MRGFHGPGRSVLLFCILSLMSDPFGSEMVDVSIAESFSSSLSSDLHLSLASGCSLLVLSLSLLSNVSLVIRSKSLYPSRRYFTRNSEHHE